MTDLKKRHYHNYEALRAFVAFFLMAFLVSVSLDVGYFQAKKFDLQGSVNLAAMTAVEALPNTYRARGLAINIASSQGVPLQHSDMIFDANRQWLEIHKTDYYETMFLKHVGIHFIPVKVHAFDFKPGI